MALSSRGQHLLTDAPLPAYVRAHFAAHADPDRPDYTGLCIAENKLVWDLLAPQLCRAREVPPWTTGYGPMIGAAPFREQLAAFLSRELVGRGVLPEHLAVLAGAGAILEQLFTVITDPGDGVLVPTPSYAGFWADVETRPGAHIVPVHTHARDGFTLTTAHLDAAADASPHPVKVLLLTNPDNPTGRVMDPERVRELIAWARGRGLQVVMNEVYGLSVFDGAFTSAARGGPLGDDVHLVWAFSKDIGASGLRCGVLVSENAHVIGAVDALAYWACVSGDTQYRLGAMISDTAWVAHYLRQMRGRLAAAHATVTRQLDEAGIPYVASRAALFVLCDLRAWLAAPTWEAEHDLWRRLLDEAQVNLTPGAECRISEPGFFRICFAAEDTARVGRALERVTRLLDHLRT